MQGGGKATMVLAIESDLVVLDFESTGACEGHPNLPWQIGAVFFRHGRVLPEHCLVSHLRVPESHPFNPYAPGRWAALRAELAQSPSLLELWPQLSPWLTGRPLAAHHAPTERSLLRHTFAFHDFPHWVDSLVLARAAYPGLESYQLGDLLGTLGLVEKTCRACPGREAHDALFDAVACGYLLEHILSQPGWRDARLDDLIALGTGRNGG